MSVRGLRKRFGEKVAVKGVDLDVPRGSFYGFVGPNGAGKTTTLSTATGLLRPDRGTVAIDGEDLWADPVAGKAKLGILPDEISPRVLGCPPCLRRRPTPWSPSCSPSAPVGTTDGRPSSCSRWWARPERRVPPSSGTWTVAEDTRGRRGTPAGGLGY